MKSAKISNELYNQAFACDSMEMSDLGVSIMKKSHTK